MSDRVFGTAMLLLAIGYGVIAWQLEAPFQYDPLGPESWPKILTFVLGACAVYLLARPDAEPSWGGGRSLGKLMVAAAALSAYALLFEPLGFMLATIAFAAGLAWYSGARPASAAIYGLLLGTLGYVIATRVLELNLPRGPIPF